MKLKRLLWHDYASDAIIKGLAECLNEDVYKWGIARLIHALDIEITNANVIKYTMRQKNIKQFLFS